MYICIYVCRYVCVCFKIDVSFFSSSTSFSICECIPIYYVSYDSVAKKILVCFRKPSECFRIY